MTLTHSLHDRVNPQPHPAMWRRTVRPSAARQRPSHTFMAHHAPIQERRRTEVSEPTLSIEEMIRRFTEEQPAQLYRGGA